MGLKPSAPPFGSGRRPAANGWSLVTDHRGRLSVVEVWTPWFQFEYWLSGRSSERWHWGGHIRAMKTGERPGDHARQPGTADSHFREPLNNRAQAVFRTLAGFETGFRPFPAPLEALSAGRSPPFRGQAGRWARHPLGHRARRLRAVSKFPSPSSSARRSVFLAKPRYRTLA